MSQVINLYILDIYRKISMQVHRIIAVSTQNDSRTRVKNFSTWENSESCNVLKGSFLSSIRHLVTYDYPRLLDTSLRKRTWAKYILPAEQHNIFFRGGGIPAVYSLGVIATQGGGVHHGLEVPCPIRAIVSCKSLTDIVSRVPARDIHSYKRHHTQQSPK